jgi:glycosyltransferase involved in cell wall biosynthesis
MMKILYINYVKPGTGPWVHASQFLAALKELHANTVGYPSLSNGNQSEPAVLHENNVRPKPFRGVRSVISAFSKKILHESRALDRLNPDIIILRAGPYLSSLPLSHLKQIPLVLEVNGPVRERFLWGREYYHLRSLPLWEQMEKGILNMASHVIVVSKPLRDLYVDRGINPNKVTTIPNGVDVETFRPSMDGKSVKRKLGLENAVVLGFSGHFSPWHGMDFMFAATEELFSQLPNVVLLLIGQSKSFFTMPTPIKGRTIMAGYVPHSSMPDFLEAVDIFLAPYPRVQPFYFSPLKLLEAMSMGKPVLASAQGQISEIIQDGESGMLYPPDDKMGFIEKLRLLISDQNLREVIGAKARERVMEKYTWKHTAKSIFQICENMYESKHLSR